MTKAKEAWAVRCWHWKSTDAKYEENADLLDVQEEQWRRVPSKAMAHHWGKKLAAHPFATSPGLYDVMRGTPDPHSMDGYDWAVYEEVRP
jgi:hypothetical protein